MSKVKKLTGKEVMDLFASGEKFGAYVQVSFLKDFLGNIYLEEDEAREGINALPDDYWIGMTYTDYDMDLPSLYSCHGCDDYPDQVTLGIHEDLIQGELSEGKLWVWEA